MKWQPLIKVAEAAAFSSRRRSSLEENQVSES